MLKKQESMEKRHRRWGVDELLGKFAELRILPSREEGLKIGGELRFRVIGPGGLEIEDCYSIELKVPPRFPKDVPTVLETGGRIPRAWHKLTDGSLCLAAETEFRLALSPGAKLCGFVERFVIPYLFNYSSLERNGELPFGELEHGLEGIRQYFAELYGVTDRDSALEFVRLTSLSKRVAHRERCPCGSGRRLVLCHATKVNELRRKLGWRWFASEYERLKKEDSVPRTLVRSTIGSNRGQNLMKVDEPGAEGGKPERLTPAPKGSRKRRP